RPEAALRNCKMKFWRGPNIERWRFTGWKQRLPRDACASFQGFGRNPNSPRLGCVQQRTTPRGKPGLTIVDFLPPTNERDDNAPLGTSFHDSQQKFRFGMPLLQDLFS